MTILLGDHAFDPARTAVSEKHAEIGGRDARVIQIKGVIEDPSTPEAVEAALDAILASASDRADNTPLVLRPRRCLFVRRTGFIRDVRRDPPSGAFTLHLEARNPYEVALDETELAWEIAASGATVHVQTNGNAEAPLTIALTALTPLENIAITDDRRSIAYPGRVAAGETIVFDGGSARVVWEDTDVTPYAEGLFPCVAPHGATLTWTGLAEASPCATAIIRFRDRWW